MIDSHNATLDRNYIRGFIDEAGAIGDARLVAHLRAVLDEIEASLARYDEANPRRDAALAEHEAAAIELRRATAARDAGSVDRKEALRLAGDAEHARQVERIRARAVVPLESACSSALGRVSSATSKVRAAAQEATRAAEAIALSIARGNSYTVNPARDPLFDKWAEAKIDFAVLIRELGVDRRSSTRIDPSHLAEQCAREFNAACERRRADRAGLAQRAAAEAKRLAG